MKKLILPFLFNLLLLISHAQGVSSSNPDEFMTWNLKIYVVLAVLFIILIFLFIFLFRMERRLNQMEQKQIR